MGGVKKFLRNRLQNWLASKFFDSRSGSVPILAMLLHTWTLHSIYTIP